MSFIVQPLQLFSIGPSRSFGAPSNLFGPVNPLAGISGYITNQENSVDAIEITQQPVQQGASIADHAFKKPITLSLQILFPSTITQTLGQIYASLIALQSSYVPFNVITPKRTYYNMLFSALGVTTDKKTENTLSVNASFQEVIIVPVITTIVPRSQLSKPASNLGTQSVGQNSSFFRGVVDGVKAFAAGTPPT